MKCKILFVDDEPRVLQGLKRMLRGTRRDWDVGFAQSGQEALDLMASNPFDVVVADMRMPGMDGVKLLNQVTKEYPEAVRLILSGQSQEAKTLRCVGPAHQFLSKPCNSELLRSKITRALAAQSFLANPELKRVVSRLTLVPSLPSSYQELTEELESPQPSIARVAEIIASDTGMSAKVLQLVSSAFFGFYRHISGPKQAVHILGPRTLKMLVELEQAFAPYTQDEPDDFKLETIVRHSNRVSTYARIIAGEESKDSKVKEHALIAGLLHDIGKIILISNLPKQYGQVLALVRKDNILLWQAEQKIFGTTHAQVGAYLLSLWGLSESIIEAVAFHHCPKECPHQEFDALTAVHIADALEQKRHPELIISATPSIDTNYLKGLGIDNRLNAWLQSCHGADQKGENCEQKSPVCR